MTARRRAIVCGAFFALLLSVTLVSSSPLATVDSELLTNGSFENGFTYLDGCGMVGQGWQCFSNGGTAAYGFYDEMWSPVVWDGEHSQLIEINTRQMGGDPDRYAGIFQTVDVIPGVAYDFSIRGMLRADDDDPDPWRYRVQIGFDHSGGSDWSSVSNWIELPWDDYYPRTEPGSFSEYFTPVVAEGSRLTVFVRVWMKWGTWYRELDVNVDGISLYGPTPFDGDQEECCIDWTTGAVMSSDEALMIAQSSECALYGQPTGHYFCNEETATWWVDLDADVPGCMPACVIDVNDWSVEINWRCTGGVPPLESATCDGPDMLANGNFEGGFHHGIGNGWGAFDNNESADYGFYDDMWWPVVAGGAHSQLIEINTLGLAASEADRYAGIYQSVWGLWPGETYELSLYGMIRQGVRGWDGDPYRYRVQWGYTANGSTDWTQVANWEELPWDTIYPRTQPGNMEPFSVQFEAPSSQITLFLRAWKKWGNAQEELDVNLDEITLRPCEPEPPCTHEPPCPHHPPGPYHPVCPDGPPCPHEPMPPDPHEVMCLDDPLCADGHDLIEPFEGPCLDGMVCPDGPESPDWHEPVCLDGMPCPDWSGPHDPVCPDGDACWDDDDLVAQPEPPFAPEQVAVPAEAQCMIHVIQRGDTLSTIAAAYGSAVASIVADNGIANPNVIYVGHELLICSP